jgi:hypothetical protein
MIFDLSNTFVKRIIFVFTLFFLGLTNCFSQSSFDNPVKLVDFLGQEKFDEILSSNPSYLTFLDVKCTSLYTVLDLPSEKTQSMTVLNEIEKRIWDTNVKTGDEILNKVKNLISTNQFIQELQSPNFNILEYTFAQDRSTDKYYVLGNSGKVIVIHSVNYITELANAKL